MEHSLEYFQKTKNKIAKFEQITNSHTRVWSLFLKRRNLCWKKPRHHNIILILKGNERKAPLPIEITQNIKVLQKKKTQNINHIFSTEDSRNLKSVFHCSDSFEKNQTPITQVLLSSGFSGNRTEKKQKKEWKTLHLYFQLLERRITSVFFHREVFP